MTVKDKQAKQKSGNGWILLVFAVLVILSILSSFIGILQASIIGLITTVSVVLFLRKKVKSKTATQNENVIYGVAVIVSLFLAMDVLTFGFIYSQGGYTPQLLNVSFPTAQQASSIFNTRLVITSKPSSSGNAGTGASKILAEATENYQLASNSSHTYFTISVFQYNNSTDAAKVYDGWLSLPFNNITGNYNGLTYIVFGTYGVGYIGSYEIEINASHHLNQTSTVNFLKKETDIINGNG